MISLIISIWIVLLNVSLNASNSIRNSCDIDAVLEAQSLPLNSMALTSLGDYEEATEVLIPTSISDGTYSEYVTRKSSNVYKVDGKNVFVKTKYCYEYAYGQNAIIEITNYQGYTFGEVTFK